MLSPGRLHFVEDSSRAQEGSKLALFFEARQMKCRLTLLTAQYRGSKVKALNRIGFMGL